MVSSKPIVVPVSKTRRWVSTCDSCFKTVRHYEDKFWKVPEVAGEWKCNACKSKGEVLNHEY